MIESRLIIKQQLKSSDDTILQYGIIINKDKSINAEKIKNNINNILKNYEIVPDIETILLIIMNVLKDTEFLNLWVTISKEKDYEEKAEYKRNILNSYTYIKEESINNVEKIIIDYNLEKGINFNIIKNKKNDLDISKIHQIINEKITKLESIQELKQTNLTYYDKLICKIYNIFYQEKPNFNKNEDRMKAHSMLALLEEFNINTPSNYDSDYSFNLNSKNIVTSKNLTQKLNKIALFGEIEETFEELNFSKEITKIIEIVGEKIRESMKQQENPIEWLTNLVRIDYVKNNYVASNYSVKEIAAESQNDEETVYSNLMLIKSINNRINKN